MAKRAILKFKEKLSPESLNYYIKTVREGLERDGIIFVNNEVEVYLLDDNCDIEIVQGDEV